MLSNKTKLCIIGNGFDMAHGLKTGYKDFLEVCAKEKPVINYRKLLTDFNKAELLDDLFIDPKIDWNNIEDAIDKILRYYREAAMLEGCNREDLSYTEKKRFDMIRFLPSLEYVNQLFDALSETLMNYLNDVESNSDIKLRKNLIEEICERTHVISFNYTSLIRNYSSDVDFVHGNIKDDGFIVLGNASGYSIEFQDRELADFIKVSRIQHLHFRRYLRRNNVPYSESLKAEFTEYIRSVNSPRAEYNFTKNTSPILKEYAMSGGNEKWYFEHNYSGINEVILMGHSLRSDRLFFNYLASSIPYIDKIKLFTYEDEKESSISCKKDKMLKIFGCKQIEEKQY